MTGQSLILHAHLPALARGRAHEVEGAAAHGFAFFAAGRQSKPVVLISGDEYAVDPYGAGAFFDVSQLSHIACRTPRDRLWVMEEALKSKAFGVVIADLDRAIGLTEGRRLQLAAEAGEALGLCLIPPSGGAPSAETRWRSTPLCGPKNQGLPKNEAPKNGSKDAFAKGGDSTRMRWDLIKNKRGTIGQWEVAWDGATRCLHLVSGSAGAPVDPQGNGLARGVVRGYAGGEKRPTSLCPV
ncbi:MAG: hypothetical protein AAF850_10360 [Pseudomonadota bacterium]